MEIDIFLQEPIHSNDLVVGSNEPKHMEEEPESLTLGIWIYSAFSKHAGRESLIKSQIDS